MKSGLIIGLGSTLNGDEGFGGYVLEVFSNEAFASSVQLFYMRGRSE
jgi:Ni,Fe-hydrogenase maturation factor